MNCLLANNSNMDTVYCVASKYIEFLVNLAVFFFEIENWYCAAECMLKEGRIVACYITWFKNSMHTYSRKQYCALEFINLKYLLLGRTDSCGMPDTLRCSAIDNNHLRPASYIVGNWWCHMQPWHCGQEQARSGDEEYNYMTNLMWYQTYLTSLFVDCGVHTISIVIFMLSYNLCKTLCHQLAIYRATWKEVQLLYCNISLLSVLDLHWYLHSTWLSRWRSVKLCKHACTTAKRSSFWQTVWLSQLHHSTLSQRGNYIYDPHRCM